MTPTRLEEVSLARLERHGVEMEKVMNDVSTLFCALAVNTFGVPPAHEGILVWCMNGIRAIVPVESRTVSPWDSTAGCIHGSLQDVSTLLRQLRSMGNHCCRHGQVFWDNPSS